jgi:sRNA-binding carbon storage regulator CsrA
MLVPDPRQGERIVIGGDIRLTVTNDPRPSGPR